MENYNEQPPAVIITGSGKIAATINGKSYTVDKSHPKYDACIESIKARNWNQFVELIDITKQVKNYLEDSNEMDILDGSISYYGQVIHNTLTMRIINFMRDGLPHEPLLNFFKNLMENPSKRAVDELYDFLDAGELPITEDGHFLAFKNVRPNFKDIHSNTFDNSIGSICEMPRNMVDDNRDRTCSQGLHFCSIKYLPYFSFEENGHTMIVKINPKDVVSIPSDYDNAKGRTCRYEVVAEYKENWREKLQQEESGWSSGLYSSNGGEYDMDEEYDDEEEYEEDAAIYGSKPCGSKYHNVRDCNGRFTKKV